MQKTQKPQRKSIKDEFVELFWTLFWALIIALFLRTIFFQPFHIPSASMYPQLMIGDYLLSSKYPYGYSHYSLPLSPKIFSGRILAHAPERGDIVVFKWPVDHKTNYIKRVIGVPGDKVQVKGGRLWLNGKQIPFDVLGEEAVNDGRQHVVTRIRETLPNGKSYITWDSGRSMYDDTPVEIIPPKSYFMMGDNRDNSQDSRKWGVVKFENLVGRGEVILVSVNENFHLLQPWTWGNFRKRGFQSLRKSR